MSSSTYTKDVGLICVVLLISVLSFTSCSDDTMPAPTPTCSDQTCAGCCMGGVCQPGMLDTACGTGGAACQSCGSDSCNKGVCGKKQPPQPACSYSNCGGCCQNDKCMSGSSQQACGQNGEVCKQCTGGTACHKGTCKPCGLETCPNGCCQNMTCMNGNTASACGANGGACTACTQDQECKAGACQTVAKKCSASNCTGCCQGDVCENGDQDSACGSGGAACQTCTGTMKCSLVGSTRLCKTPTDATYSVALDSAVITKLNSKGKEWDTPQESGCLTCILGCCPPDVYARQKDLTYTGSVVAGMVPSNSVVANSITPKWSMTLGTASTSQLTGGAISIMLMDDDAGILTNDLIGECKGTIQSSDLLAGQIVLTKAAKHCTGNVVSITITFKKL